MDNVKFDTKTINILKSFSLINPSMIFKEGNVMTTVSPLKNIFARATIPVNLEKKFCVYSLSRFLNTLSLFNDPSISIGDKQLTIKDGNTKSVNYALAEEDTVPVPQTKEANFPDGEVVFNIDIDNIKDIERSMGILNLNTIAITGDGHSINLRTFDVSGAVNDTFSISIGDTTAVFNAVFKPEHIGVLSKSLTTSYVVDLSTRGFAHFKAPDIEYWIATEAVSTFN